MTYNLDGSGGDLTVDSSDATVATVTLSGDTLTVNAISLGTTTITARRAETSTHNAVSSSFVLTVNKIQATITGLPNELALNANTSMTYNLGGSGGDLTVDSSNSTVATVTLSGDTLTVNAISLGTTTITARRAETSTHNAVSSSFVLTVNKIQATITGF